MIRIRETTETERMQVQKLITQMNATIKDLPTNLLRELGQSGWSAISEKTCDQLSKWCHHYQQYPTDRETAVEPLAHEVSRILFGRVIPRSPNV